jgi:16S rRNA (cytosine1407-C5)-methyltransferase
LHRLGVSNVIVTKKVGQWFGKHMTERFDRVLCDAPCTAQGTARKDSDALRYSSEESIGVMARLQAELLEAAVHATKVGGRIVYSTCTLSPEENEFLVRSILNKYKDQLEPVNYLSALAEANKVDLSVGEKDAFLVQAAVDDPIPAVRLWPQTYDTEGFFVAVLQKTASTRDIQKFDWLNRQEQPVSRVRAADYRKSMIETYGTDFHIEGDALSQREDHLLLTTTDCQEFGLTVQDYSMGLPFAKGLKDGRVRLTTELVTLRGHMAERNVLEITESELGEILSGKDVPCPVDLRGDVILLYQGIIVGLGLATSGTLKNRISRWIVGHQAA